MNETPETEEKKLGVLIEDYQIIWLDAATDSNCNVLFKRQSSLETSSNCIRGFVDQHECIEFIHKNNDKHIFLIVSGSLGENAVPLIHNLIQVFRIYIFCTDKGRHELWSKSFMKVRGVFIDDVPLVACLKKDIKMYLQISIPISIGSMNERSLQYMNEEQANFLWFQLLIEVIYRLPQTSTAKKHMIEECREHYADNDSQLRTISEFSENYTADSAIFWYTKDCFVYRLLNRAFRTQNIDLIFNYHFFLTDLYKQLTSLYQEQFHGKTGKLTVYRGQYLSVRELEKLQNSIACLISINTFYSTLTSCIVAAEFCGNGEHQAIGIESVVFQIDIDLAIQRLPFARIDKRSVNSTENEVLVSLGSVFRIEEVELLTEYIWLIKLSLSNEVKKELDELLAYFTKHIGNQPSILELGVLLSKIGDFQRAERFYRRLLVELPSDHIDLGVIYNNLGEVYRQQGYFSEALDYYKKALHDLTDTVGFRDEWFAVVHSNMAMIFHARKEFEIALVHFRCSLLILTHIDSEDAELFSTIYNGMAAVFQEKGDLKRAAELYQKVLNIEKQVLPASHPSLAVTYANIGTLCLEMNHISSALNYMQNALSILLNTLPQKHPQLATTYTTLGGIYYHLHENSEALDYLLKAENIIDQCTLSFDHKLRKTIYGCIYAIAKSEKKNDISIRVLLKLINLFNTCTPPDLSCVAMYANNLGKLYFDMGDNNQASQYYELALHSIEALPHTYENMKCCEIIARAFQHLGRPDITRECLTRLVEAEINNQTPYLASLNNYLGTLFDIAGENLLALKYFTAAWTCYMNWPDIHWKEIAISRHNIAAIQQDLGNYEEARIHLLESRKIVNQNEYQLRAQIDSLLAETYIKLHSWAHAAECFENAIELASKVQGFSSSTIEMFKNKLETVLSMMKKSEES